MKSLSFKQIVAIVWPSARISLALVSILTSILLFSDLLGLTPNHRQYEMETRKRIAETFAITVVELIQTENLTLIRRLLAKTVEKNDTLESAGFRYVDGRLLFQINQHESAWGEYDNTKSTSTHIQIPLYKNAQLLGRIELKFKPLTADAGIFSNKTYRWIAFVASTSLFFFLAFMLRTLRQIDPSAVIPDRVNAAFDTLAEGVVILDDREHIVLANKAFTEFIGRPSYTLMGLKLSELGWKRKDTEFDNQPPWVDAYRTGKHRIGDKLAIDTGLDASRTMLINSAPIMDANNNPQGMLLTFDDVTDLEKQKLKLQTMVDDLEISRKEIQRQNKELYYLATRDPLTGSFNRRYFYEEFEKRYQSAKASQKPLCCIMVDIDHFKNVNDTYGHDIGDQVIKMLAFALNSVTRDVDLVGRYGGEEFCVILPDLPLDDVLSVAERIRLKIYRDSGQAMPNGEKVTASLGVASIDDGSTTHDELNKQADQALYAAKNSGRNRVVRWIPAFSEARAEDASQKASQAEQRLSLTDGNERQDEMLNLQQQIQQLEKVASSFADQLQKEKHFDKVTGLPNHSLFYDRVNEAMERSGRAGTSTAVLITEFAISSLTKALSDQSSLDQLYSEVASRLQSSIRKSTSISVYPLEAEELKTVSRMSQDEFGILLPDLRDTTSIPGVIDRIMQKFAEPLNSEHQSFKLTFRIGISLYPDDATTPEELISHAAIAKAKAENEPNTGTYQFFDKVMQEEAHRQLLIEKEIHHSVKLKQWQLYYQPKLDLKTDTVTGVEGLIRWNHPKRGLLGPMEFIPIAEERGLIIEIGEWVLQEACAQIAAWNKAGIHLKVSVNISALQLRLHNLSDLILQSIDNANISRDQLELELTETMLINNYDMAIKSLTRLHANGVRILMDDFGTGYSSLTYLKKLPVDTIKIDRSFVQNIVTNNDDRSIVKTVINMAQSLNLTVVAEGVEEKEQLALLRAFDCDEIQGFFLARPMSAENLERWLQEQKTSNQQK